jgi:hypothetical protein
LSEEAQIEQLQKIAGSGLEEREEEIKEII